MKIKDWLILIIPVAIIFIIILFPFIPDKIPMQFNARGEVNWYLPKYVFPVVGIIPFLIYLRYKDKNKKD